MEITDITGQFTDLDDGKRAFQTGVGGIVEYPELQFITNCKWDNDDYPPCNVYKDGVIPLTVIVHNEGWSNSTVACVHCIIEAAQKIEEILKEEGEGDINERFKV